MMMECSVMIGGYGGGGVVRAAATTQPSTKHVMPVREGKGGIYQVEWT